MRIMLCCQAFLLNDGTSICSSTARLFSSTGRGAAVFSLCEASVVPSVDRFRGSCASGSDCSPWTCSFLGCSMARAWRRIPSTFSVRFVFWPPRHIKTAERIPQRKLHGMRVPVLQAGRWKLSTLWESSLSSKSINCTGWAPTSFHTECTSVPWSQESQAGWFWELPGRTNFHRPRDRSKGPCYSQCNYMLLCPD
jgi:hypothetical protein